MATAHYESIMTRSGQNFVDFVKNLDHMHQRIRVTFPNYNPPSFRVKVLAPGQLQVDYYSDRAGLLPLLRAFSSPWGAIFVRGSTLPMWTRKSWVYPASEC